MKVTIDKNSGYCFGVEYAIQMAEDAMADKHNTLYCLGDIVHNAKEVERLEEKGLKIIDRDEMSELRDAQVLIRAHGEPPETYRIALENNLELIDASCPVVLKLQNRVKNAFDSMQRKNGQIVIYGKKGHAEVEGLNGQTNENAIIVSDNEDLNKVDFNAPITLFSQTTKSTAGFYKIKDEIKKRITDQSLLQDFNANDSICRQVSNREPQLRQFAHEHDIILFVAGRKSSNGKALYQAVLDENPNSFFIEGKDEIDPKWIDNIETVGICGATSTPMWLMKEVGKQAQLLKEEIRLVTAQ